MRNIWAALWVLAFGLGFQRRHLSFIQRDDREQSVEIREFSDQKQKQKKLIRKYKKGKFRKRKTYRPQFFKLKGGRPKDVRFSNQQKLRRMFRNS